MSGGLIQQQLCFCCSAKHLPARPGIACHQHMHVDRDLASVLERSLLL